MSNKTDHYLGLMREGAESDAPAKWFGMFIDQFAEMIDKERHAAYLRGVREAA